MLRFRQQQFVSFVIQNQNLFLPNLVYFPRNDFTDTLFVQFIQVVFLQLHDARNQVLTQRKNVTTPKITEFKFFCYFFTNFEIWLHFNSIRVSDFRIRIFYFSIINDFFVQENLNITFINVYNDIDVLICVEFFLQHCTKNVL